MIAAGVTWLPATPRTAFRGHAFLLALADPKLQPHPSKSEAAPESAALSEEAMPSGAPTAVRPPLPSSRRSEPGTQRRGAPGRTSGGRPARRKAGHLPASASAAAPTCCADSLNGAAAAAPEAAPASPPSARLTGFRSIVVATTGLLALARYKVMADKPASILRVPAQARTEPAVRKWDSPAAPT